MTINAKCPACGKPSVISKSNKWRPFCCERCSLIDLGAWIDGSNRIAGSDVNPDFIETLGSDPPTRH